MEYRKRTFLEFSQRENAALPAVYGQHLGCASINRKFYCDCKQLLCSHLVFNNEAEMSGGEYFFEPLYLTIHFQASWVVYQSLSPRPYQVEPPNPHDTPMPSHYHR